MDRKFVVLVDAEAYPTVDPITMALIAGIIERKLNDSPADPPRPGKKWAPTVECGGRAYVANCHNKGKQRDEVELVMVTGARDRGTARGNPLTRR